MTDEQVAKYVRYLNPSESPIGADAAADLAQHLADWQPALVVLDGFNAGMTLAGLKVTDNNDATHYMQAVLMPIAATGACVVYVDHVPKSREDESRGGIGAQAKRAMTSGCTLRVEVTSEFGRGQRGVLQLRVDKDRPGAVRGASLPNTRGAWWATVEIESRQFGIDITILAPDISSLPAPAPTKGVEDYRRAVMDYVGSSDLPLSKRGIVKGVGGRTEAILEAIDSLVADGHLAVAEGARGSQLHTAVRPLGADIELDPIETLTTAQTTVSDRFSAVPEPGNGQETVGGKSGSASDPLLTVSRTPVGGPEAVTVAAPDEGRETVETLDPNLRAHRVVERTIAGELVRVDLGTGEVLP